LNARAIVTCSAAEGIFQSHEPRHPSEELLEEMPRDEASEVRGLLAFDENTAGGMMNPEFVFVGETATRDEVLQWMRLQDLNVDQLDTIVLLDSDARFSGTVPVSRLLSRIQSNACRNSRRSRCSASQGMPMRRTSLSYSINTTCAC